MFTILDSCPSESPVLCQIVVMTHTKNLILADVPMLVISASLSSEAPDEVVLSCFQR